MIPITTAFAHARADKASRANPVAEKAITRKSILGNVWFGNGKTERQTQVGGTNRLFHVAGTIGTTSCQYSYRRGRSIHFRLPIRRGEPFLLLLKELYPPDEPGLRERFSVRVNGLWEANMDHTGNGFGTGTSFIPITDRAALAHSPAEIDLSSEDKQTNHNGTAAPNPAPGGEMPGIAAGGGDISITGVVALRPLETLQPDLLRDRPFSILGLVDPRKEEDITYIRDTAADPNPTPISTGFSSEIFYAARLDSALQDQIRTALTESGKLGVEFLPIWSSWWGGTPLHTPDGRGGTFGDLKYQQICWSPTDTLDESGLRTLLGPRWNIHYGLTIPNLWSNTPWLTMNNDQLNQFRINQIARLGGWLHETLAASHPGSVLGLVTDNEPRYWDMDCPDRYPIHREELEGDFNPDTVVAAARDGVDLNPEAGLSPAARWWLHQNIARYIGATAAALGRACPGVPVYTHNLTKPGFPMRQLGSYHPMMETCRIEGARVGVEDLSNPDWSLYSRLREWGRWACVNREENDGLPLPTHTAMIGEMYAAGADFVNCYNWQSIGRDRWRQYIQDFTAHLPVRATPVEAASSGVGNLQFTAPPACPGLTGFLLPRGTFAGAVHWTILSSGGDVLLDRLDEPHSEEGAEGELLDAGAWIPLQRNIKYTLQVRTREGQPVALPAAVDLICDLAAERARSILSAEPPLHSK